MPGVLHQLITGRLERLVQAALDDALTTLKGLHGAPQLRPRSLRSTDVALYDEDREDAEESFYRCPDMSFGVMNSRPGIVAEVAVSQPGRKLHVVAIAEEYIFASATLVRNMIALDAHVNHKTGDFEGATLSHFIPRIQNNELWVQDVIYRLVSNPLLITLLFSNTTASLYSPRTLNPSRTADAYRKSP
jgi:hypothetical protein